MTDTEADVRAIKAVIERQFSALSWSEGSCGDWETFAADFAEGATFFPAARPVKLQSIVAFLARMKNAAGNVKSDGA